MATNAVVPLSTQAPGVPVAENNSNLSAQTQPQVTTGTSSVFRAPETPQLMALRSVENEAARVHAQTLAAGQAEALRNMQGTDDVQPDNNHNQSDNADGPENEYDSEGDQTMRDAQLAEGANAALQQRSIPSYVSEAYKPLFRVVQGVWRRNPRAFTPQELEQINTCDERIKGGNQAVGVAPNLHLFPRDTITTSINNIMRLCDARVADRNDAEKARQAVQEISLFSTTMKNQFGIAWRQLTDVAFRVYLKNTLEIDASKLCELFCELTPHQKATIMGIQEVKEHVPKLFGLTGLQGDLASIDAAIDALNKANTALRQQEQSLEMGVDGQQIIMESLQIMRTAAQDGINEQFKLHQKYLWHYFALIGIKFEQATDPDPENQTQFAILDLVKSIAPYFYPTNDPATSAANSTANPTTNPASNPTGGSSTNGKTNLMSMYNNLVVPVRADPRGDCTQFGKILQVRKQGYGYRALINRGTDVLVRLVVMTGTDLGGEYHKAKTFYRNSYASPDINKPMDVISCAEASGSGSRRPNCYYAVRSEGRIYILTHTELIQRLGKKRVESFRESYIELDKSLEKAFASYRALGLHPETSNPLTDSDIQRYPWLSQQPAGPVAGPGQPVGPEQPAQSSESLFVS